MANKTEVTDKLNMYLVKAKESRYRIFEEYAGFMQELFTDCLELLENQPNIVRCKDCKHRDPEDKKCDCGHDIHWQLPRPDNWFCADGERAE